MDFLSLYSILNGIEVDEETELPKTFDIPNLSTGNENTIYNKSKVICSRKEFIYVNS